MKEKISKDQTIRDLKNSQDNVQTLQVRLLKELCSRDYLSKQSGNILIFDIQDIYTKSFKDIEKKQFLRFLTWFAQDSGYIQFLLQNKIALLSAEIIASSHNNIDKQFIYNFYHT